MDRQRELLLQLLPKILPLQGLVLKNNTLSRELEGLQSCIETVWDPPRETLVREGGLEFLLPLQQGQKTGWYYDQAPNREYFARLCSSIQLLDVFCYIGALTAAALKQDASWVTAVMLALSFSWRFVMPRSFFRC